jgi:hypothetical protein
MRNILIFMAMMSLWHLAIAQDYKNPKNNEATPQQSQYGAESKPLSVKLVPTPASEAKAQKDESDTRHKHTLDLFLVIGTFVLAFFTLLLWVATYRLAKDARTSGDTHAQKMEASITEATRAANAMESVATATKNNASLMQDILHKQMRAYISVDTGTGTYQDKDHRFAATAVIVNTGFTPARNLHYRIMADIINVESIKPEDLVIPPEGDLIVNDVVISPRQKFIISGIVPLRFEDSQAAEIMLGDKKRLFVWGVVTYDDVFSGNRRTTRFCHSYNFYEAPNNTISHTPFYHCTHNDAD